jgi:hypothetical protein
VVQQRRIKVTGKQRKEVDPGLMAQLVIALGKRLAEQQGPTALRRRSRPASPSGREVGS